MTMRLLLINPKFPDSFWSFKWAVSEVLPNKRTTNPPLGLATLAALCPSDWEVEIIDENVEPVPLEPNADLIGICGMGVQFPRQSELLTYYRSRGHKVVAGGSYASLCPENYEGIADFVIAGEAEHIWKQFCTDYQMGIPQTLYKETGTVELVDSPTPRFDLLKLDRYSSVTLQFSRGCPYRCEFCDIIVMFGRKPRVKPLEQVGLELDALRKQGVVRVFFVDDNLIGNRPACKKLLQFLKEYQDKHNYRFSFGTEASLNMAADTELLKLFRDAGFGWVFIGIESPDPASLKETLKTQNMNQDILGSIAKIYSFGIEVLAGFIIGFDNDTIETFEAQYTFITASGIQAAMVGLLHALPKTPLYERLEKAGRLRPFEHDQDNSKLGTNVLPLQMDYDAMVDGYRTLYQRLTTDENIALRMRNKIRQMGPPVFTGGFTQREGLAILGRLFFKGIVPGGISRIALFLGTFPLRRPELLALWVSDWITGLSMQGYVKQHFAAANADQGVIERRVAAVRRALAGYLEAGKVTLSFRQPDLALSMKALVDGRFFQRAAPGLERLLKHTRARLTLRIDALPAQQQEHLSLMLSRLARYGDRVSIIVDEKVRSLIRIDSSVFNLVLAGPEERSTRT
jgi:radical SAM superfamily enzyme YgiQ (UPF0313 family)